MSTQFYKNMARTASNLLTRFGHNIELIDSNRTVLDTYQGLKTGLSSENVSSTVLEQSTAVVFITVGNITPQMGQYLRINDVIYRITHIDDIKPTNIGLLYKIYIADGA